MTINLNQSIIKSYEEIHTSKTGKVSDKWSSYFAIYDDIFAKHRLSTGDLLEIGVQNGGSLEVWSEYFPKFASITGIDIDQKCSQLKYSDHRIKVFIGNATRSDGIPQAMLEPKGWNIIIDDGSHFPHDIINSFLLFFPLVREGGIYLIEDTHVGYGKVPGGGVLNPQSVFSFFLQLTHMLNREFWEQSYNAEVIHESYFAPNSPPPILDGGWIKSISFFNSIIVIHKESSYRLNKLGERKRCGEEMSVQSWGLNQTGG